MRTPDPTPLIPNPVPEEDFFLGDEVEFRFGSEVLSARVTEHIGRIGVGGRSLYEVEFEMDHMGVRRTVLPASSLRLIRRPSEPTPLFPLPSKRRRKKPAS